MKKIFVQTILFVCLCLIARSSRAQEIDVIVWPDLNIGGIVFRLEQDSMVRVFAREMKLYGYLHLIPSSEGTIWTVGIFGDFNRSNLILAGFRGFFSQDLTFFVESHTRDGWNFVPRDIFLFELPTLVGFTSIDFHNGISGGMSTWKEDPFFWYIDTNTRHGYQVHINSTTGLANAIYIEYDQFWNETLKLSSRDGFKFR